MAGFPIFPALTSAYGLYQTIKADSELKKLEHEQIPQSALTPQSHALVDMGDFGYTPQEIAAFHDSLSQSENSAYRKTIERTGNNFAGTAMAAINNKKFNALADIAKSDAQLHRSNLRTAAQVEQGIADKNTQALLSDYGARQRAWGQSKQAGINNLFLGLATGLGGMSDATGNKTSNTANPTTTPTTGIVDMGNKITMDWMKNYPLYNPNINPVSGTYATPAEKAAAKDAYIKANATTLNYDPTTDFWSENSYGATFPRNH